MMRSPGRSPELPPPWALAESPKRLEPRDGNPGEFAYLWLRRGPFFATLSRALLGGLSEFERAEEVLLSPWVRATALALSAMVMGSGGAAARVTVAQVQNSPPAVAHPEGGSHTNVPALKSNAALVIDEARGITLYAKNPEHVSPIASITKLMTAMLLLDAQLPLDEPIVIDKPDADDIKHTASRLKIGTSLSRGDLLQLALMSSENRAAAALGRTYPGGTGALVAAMNQKASELGMTRTRFVDVTGLSCENVSTPQDLARMVRAACQYPLIRAYTTSPSYQVVLSDGRALDYLNSNGLVKNKTWSIGLSKTGYINEAGRCLVMQAEIATRPVIIVLLDSWGKYTRLGDANRIRKWMEGSLSSPPGSL